MAFGFDANATAAIDSKTLVATVGEEALVEFRTPPIFPGARKVHIQPNVNMISEINVLDSTFRVDLDIEMMWKVDSFDEAWDPHIEVINLADSTDVSGIDAAREKKMIDGSCYISKEVTFMLNCSQYMDIRDFPFDAHTLKFIVRSQDQPLPELQFARAFNDCDHESIRMHEYVLTDTRLVIDEMTYDHVIATEGADRARYSEFCIEIDVIRRFGYYYVKLVYPAHLLLVMQAAVFFLEPTDIGNRLAICVTMALTTISFLYVAGSFMPKSALVTPLDRLLLWVLATVAFAYIESVVVYELDKRYPDSYEAEMLDTVSLGITLVMFFLSLMSWLISKFWHRHDWSDEDDDDEDESHDKTS